MPSPESIARAAVRDAALVDAMTEDFATELATVLGKLRTKIQKLVQQLDTNPDGRIAAVRQNLALALRLRGDIQTALQQSGYPELALRSVDQPLDDLAASVLKEVGKSPQVQLAAYDVDALVAMKDLRLAELLQVGQDVAVQLWRVTLDGVVGARPVIDLVGDLTDLLEISQKRARVLYDTLVSTYSRQVAQIGTSGDPEEAFLYVGPDDERTRDFCDQHVDRVYSRGAIDQMDNGQLPNVMLTGGGYNCRHMFRRVSALDKELLDIVDTGTRFQDRNAEPEHETEQEQATAASKPEPLPTLDGEFGDDGGVVFHGTREDSLPFIQDEGLKPREQIGAQKAFGSTAFVTTKRTEAEFYANSRGWVVLEIHVPPSGAGSFTNLYGSTYGTSKVIPPEWIKAVYGREQDGSFVKR